MARKVASMSFRPRRDVGSMRGARSSILESMKWAVQVRRAAIPVRPSLVTFLLKGIRVREEDPIIALLCDVMDLANEKRPRHLCVLHNSTRAAGSASVLQATRCVLTVQAPQCTVATTRRTSP